MGRTIHQEHNGYYFVIDPNHDWYMATTLDIYESEAAYENDEDPLNSTFAQDEHEADAYAREWIARMLGIEDSPFVSTTD